MVKKVVFVDDSKMVLLTAKMATKPLVESGVIEFIDYDNPLDLINAVKNGLVYDLLITDINMPQMNGLDMAKELKSIHNIRLKPILALTTESSGEKKSIAKSIGLAGWITKPFSPEKLLMGIKRVLRLR
jgi:two-component system chemotaxis response regulator CheY